MKCEFFQVERSTCLRPIAAVLVSRERGVISLCKRHIEVQQERDLSPEGEGDPFLPPATIEWVGP